MAVALEHILRMKGGAQSHLLRCRYKDHLGEMREDGYFVVKFRNNPQHVRILANELLASKLAEFVGIPVPQVEQVEVSKELVEGTPELRMEQAGGMAGVELCATGRQIGSRFPGNPRHTPVFDWVPDDTLDELENRDVFKGTLVFDQWLCNTDGRQTVFYRSPKTRRYRALMIDQGYCFNDGEWNFPDAPLWGLYLRRRVYEDVTGWNSFEPWLTRIEQMNPGVIERFFLDVPRAWCGYDGPEAGEAQLEGLYTRVVKRREKVRDLLLAVKRSSANPFPKWV
jgi:hypothetical protein